MAIASTLVFFFFNDTATTEIYTLSLHDALPISGARPFVTFGRWTGCFDGDQPLGGEGPVASVERGVPRHHHTRDWQAELPVERLLEGGDVLVANAHGERGVRLRGHRDRGAGERQGEQDSSHLQPA